MKKRIVLLFVTCLLLNHTSNGQNKMDGLFENFRKQEQVSHINMGSMQKLIGAVADKINIQDMDILSFRDCSDELKQRFQKAIREFDDPHYETLLTSNKADQQTKILVRNDQGTIKEIIIFITGKRHSLMRIKGNIKTSDIERIMNATTHG